VRVPGGIPGQQQVPLRWWILGGSLLGIALTALIVVATRSEPEPLAVAAADAAVVAVDAAPPMIDAAPVVADAAEPEAPPDAEEPSGSVDDVADMDPGPAPMPPPRRQLRTRVEMNMAFRAERYKEIVAACRIVGADGDRANVCTLAACRAKVAIAQDWYRNVAPKERAKIVKICEGAIKDICATDLTACRK
jgi:hypothetical protein